MVKSRFNFALLAMISVVAGIYPLAGSDWPQWRGPDRDGVSKETGLLRQWPASGPTRLWQISNLGAGYGSIAIQGDRIFVQSLLGGQSTVASLNLADGGMIWSKALGPTTEDDRGPGPRGTPTVDGDRLYVLTESGDLACLKTQDGGLLWHRNILKDFGGPNPEWLISESPLIEGNKVIVTPGGSGAGVVALDKLSGKTIWTSKELSDTAGYSSVISADVQGVRVLMTLTDRRAGVGLRASDGKLLWSYPRVANRTANIATPVFFDNRVFYTSDYGTGGALLGLTAKAGTVMAQEIYFTRELKNHHGGVVLVNGYLYGFNSSILTCLEFATARMMWRDRSVGKGSLTYADGHLYLLSEDNVVGLAEASPTGYVEKGRFEIEDQGWPSWVHPVVSGGRLYIRNQGTLASYDIRTRAR
jgi:outer membrane protein assembly factor BamB